MLQHHTIPVTAFQQNCSIVWCDRTMEGAVIDPGGDLPRIRAAALRLGVTLTQILLTHAHIDHAGGAAPLARELALPIVGPHPDDQFWISGLRQQGQMFGLEPPNRSRRRAGCTMATRCRSGGACWRCAIARATRPGMSSSMTRRGQRAFVGDVLFAGSVGRTDLPGGDADTLIASITGRLWPMGDETVFIPGHGPESTFGRERRSNPYVGGT